MTETTAETQSEKTAEMQENTQGATTDPRGLYELAYHLVPTLDEEGRAAQVDALRKLIEEKGGSLVHEVYPEHFELAYTMERHIAGAIQRFDTSYLGWMNFTIEATEIPEIHDVCEKNESLIRFLLTKTEKEMVGRDVRPVNRKDPEATPGTPVAAKPAEKTDTPEKKDEKMSEEEVDKAIEELVV